MIARLFRHPVCATIASLLLTIGSTKAANAHPCAADAASRAVKLLALQAETDQPITISKTVTAVKPIRNPANTRQSFDVFAVKGYAYKSEYRMRFIYARIPGQCALVGQEILEHTGL